MLPSGYGHGFPQKNAAWPAVANIERRALLYNVFIHLML